MTRRIFPAFSIFLAACGVFGSSDDASEIPAPPEPGRPQESVAPPEAKAPPLPGKPKDDEINEGFGVFVSASAAEGGDGTRAKPYRTIAAGLDEAVKQRKRLYVCTGTFEEAVKIRNGIPMVGGFDCTAPAWTLSGARTTVKSPASPAIVAEDIDVPTRVVGFDVVAPDAADPGGSSIGLLANKAGALQIASSKITAGKAQAGSNGVEGVQLMNGPVTYGRASAPEQVNAPGPNGPLVYPLVGGAGGTNTCVGAAGIAGKPGGSGGAGGYYQCLYSAALTSYRWRPYYASGINKYYEPEDGSPGSGAGGEAGGDGASGTSGTFDANGFTPGDGAPGASGGVGNGGAGGKGAITMEAACGAANVNTYAKGTSGAGGGAGGCPGLAGTPGQGGGASVAALVITSPGLTFDASELVASDAGSGGKGTLGSSPTLGGSPGFAMGTSTAAGAGGPGGRAGVSGSGAGGPSIAIAHTGGEPKVENGTTLKPGTAGAGVPEETATDALGNVKTLPASAAGVAKDLFAF